MNILQEKTNNRNINVISSTLSLTNTESSIIISKTRLFYSTAVRINTSIEIQQPITNPIVVKI